MANFYLLPFRWTPSEDFGNYIRFFEQVETGEVSPVEQMVKTGWNVNRFNSQKETALHIAAIHGHTQMTKFLLR